MTRMRMAMGVGIVVVLMVAVCQPIARAQEKPSYTMAEYNAYTVCANEKSPQQRVKLCDDFVAKFPQSTLLPYVYVVYYRTYYELKNYPQVVEYVDRLLALGDKIDAGTQLEARVARAQSFYLAVGLNQKELLTPEHLTKARDSAGQGLKDVTDWKKPDKLTDEQYTEQKKSMGILFNSIVGIADLQLKDYKGALEAFKAASALEPSDALTHYRMGIVYIQMTPPQYMDGFWEVARAIALKIPDEARVRNFLRGQLRVYQRTECDKLVDAQLNELLALAAASTERPATYKIPSADDLQKAREGSQNVIADLRAGGDKAKAIWLATCGLEFPEVVGKVIAVSSDDAVTLKLFTGATPEETEAGTTANMEVKIGAQPEAKRIQAGDPIRFSATLVGYDPEPFMLHWEKGKVNPEDIPEAKPPAKKAPAKKSPTKRPPKKPGR